MDVTIGGPIGSLYVHVPFCHTLCGYCDFYSEVLDRRTVAPLVDALLAELRGLARDYRLAPGTIFVGGGTPTTLPVAELRRLLAGIRAHADPGADIEFTVEANPATVNSEVAQVLVACGVNRVSIGAQSFDPGELRVLERIHAPAQVTETVRTCRAAGLTNLNLDLIFAVPRQTLGQWLRNVEAALALEPDHLSCYGLTYERGTPLYRRLHEGRVQRVEAEVEAAMFEATIERLATAGFEQYEISNFARPGRRCRHNLVYWRNQPCLAIGPSAAGFDGRVRYRNVPDTAAYASAILDGRSPRVEEEVLPADRRPGETAMLELRLSEGIDAGRFRERFGDDPRRVFATPIARLTPFGVLEVDDRGVRLTRRGRLVADSVIAEFL